MTNPYLASTLLTALRDEGYLPTDEDSADARLLGVINRQQRTWLTKLMLSVREDYQYTSVDVAIDAGQTVVPVPSRAIGAALKQVSILVNGEASPLHPIRSERVNEGTALGGSGDYSMQGNSLVLNASPAAASTLRVTYFRRMNEIVDEAEAGELTDITDTTVTFSGSVPTDFPTTSTYYDFVAGRPHFDTVGADCVGTRSGNVLTFNAGVPEGLVAGDWVCLAGQTPICQAPLELHDLLVLRATQVHLRARGDPKAAVLKDEVEEMRQDALALLAPRVQGSSHVLINPNAPGVGPDAHGPEALMAVHSVLKARGLNVGDNQLALPEGSMARALNVVTPFKDVLESRRGQAFLSYTFGSSGNRSNEGVFYQGANVIHYSTASLARDTGAAFSTYSGSYTPPDATLLRMKFIEAALNLYFTTTLGIYLLDVISGTPEKAGQPKPIQMTGNTDTLNGTWFEPDGSVAYVAVLGKKDANGNVKLGAPGPRFVVSNYISVAIGSLVRTAADGSHPAGKVSATYSGFMTAGTSLRVGDVVTLAPGEANFAAGNKTVVSAVGSTFTYDEAGSNVSSTVAQVFSLSTGVELAVRLPSDATSSHFLRLYRTEQTDTADLDPGEEFFQVYETKISAGDITAGFVAISDVTPESMLGNALYTNPLSGDGVGSANERPPIAKDVCEFDGRVWYFNTTDRHRMHLQILGTGSPSGLQHLDTLTLAGRTYTFKTSGVSGLEQVQIGTTGTPGQRVEETTRNLVAKINNNTNNTLVYAFYASGENQAPGRFLVEERGFGGASFTAYTSRATAFSPGLTTSSSGAETSSNDRRPHGASYSKRGQPEAVPLTNWEPVGTANHQILRGIPLRDKIFVFTETGRIWTISGTYPYRVDSLDGTAELIGPDTAVEHANQIFALTTQGVCAISDSGVKILSSPIEPEFLERFGALPATLKQRAFGVSYESDRQYQLWLPSDTGDTCATGAFVYNSLYGTWTEWVGDRTWGRVNKSTGLLMLGDGATNKIRRERKSYTRTDFADEVLSVTISSSSGKAVTLASTTGITAGDLLYLSDAVKALVVSVDSATVVTVLSTETWVAGAASVYVAIDCDWKWATAAPGGPAVVKQFREATFHFKSWFVNTFTAVFDSDINSTETEIVLTSPGFGLTAFGSGLFGQELGSKNKPASVPKDNSTTTQIRVGGRVREAWSIWTLHGYSLSYEAGSEKNGR